MMKSQHHYEQAADSVMRYIDAKLSGRGERYTVNDKEDLRKVFEKYGWSDKGGDDKKIGKNQPLQHFIDRIIGDDGTRGTRAAQNRIPSVFGRGKHEVGTSQSRNGTVTVMEPARQKDYYYNKNGVFGRARKTTYQNKQGVVQERYRNERGQFVSRRYVSG